MTPVTPPSWWVKPYSPRSGWATSEAKSAYLELLGMGLNALNRNEEALRFFDRAMRVAAQTPDAGFPFMSYEGKGQALMGLNRLPEARATFD